MPLFLIIFMVLSFPALAEDENPQTPISEWRTAEDAIIKTLEGKDDQETYFILRNKYGVIRAIRVVKRDIGNAVQACGQENPQLQDKMNTRFKDWKKSVDPILKHAESFLRQEVREQSVLPEKEFKRIQKLNDKALDFQESRVEKKPVTEEEACLRLLESMDRTEDQMLGLMQNILLPESVIRETADQ